MSVLPNDPKSIKQNFLIIISTLLAIILFLFSGSGASLECNLKAECILKRKTLETSSSVKFNWLAVKEVKYSLSEGTSYNKKGVNGMNYSLLLENNKEIFLYQNPIVYPLGNLTREHILKNLGKKWEDTLWGVSLGGVTWFISFCLGCVSFVLVVLLNVTPIDKQMSQYELEKARKQNLLVFFFISFLFIVFWIFVLSGMIYYFVN